MYLDLFLPIYSVLSLFLFVVAIFFLSFLIVCFTLSSNQPYQKSSETTFSSVYRDYDICRQVVPTYSYKKSTLQIKKIENQLPQLKQK